MTTPRTLVSLDAAHRIGPVPPRIFGTFVEHMGRCVYGGIYEPDHPRADADGFRSDVVDLVRELGVTTVRYPGGNFVSGYDWRDGIGPRDLRPARLDRAWKAIETNAVGTDEFLGWAARCGLEPILAVNLGTRGVQNACDLLEYCNFPGGTALSDLRIRHGTSRPHVVRLWCLGNEMDGPWQVGHKTASEYGRLAAETARAMRRIDPDLELTACGSSNLHMPTFGTWEATVLDHTYDLVDRVSLHGYYEPGEDDAASFLASSVEMDAMIRAVVAVADAEGARRRSRKRIQLAFDEWNVWYQSRFAGEDALRYGGPRALIEDTYSRRDAVVVGDLLMTLLRHSDRVDVACQAQLVNVIAPIRTEPGGVAWRQSTFDPFALTARYARGDVLQPSVRGAIHETRKHGAVETVSVAATHDEERQEVMVLLVNRSPADALDVEVALHDLPADHLVECLTLAGSGADAVNGPDVADVRAGPSDAVVLREGSLTGHLPPESWTMVRIAG
jgi:alpha-N-arabinofuranosidase